MIDLQINMRVIRLLPSNNPDSTSLLESSLHKNIYFSLSLVWPLLSHWPHCPVMNVTSRGEDQCVLWAFCLFTLMSPLFLSFCLCFLSWRPWRGAGALCLTQINYRILVSCLGRLCESVHVWERAGLCTRAHIFSEVIIKIEDFMFCLQVITLTQRSTVKLNIIILLRPHIWINIQNQHLLRDHRQIYCII